MFEWLHLIVWEKAVDFRENNAVDGQRGRGPWYLQIPMEEILNRADQVKLDRCLQALKTLSVT